MLRGGAETASFGGVRTPTPMFPTGPALIDRPGNARLALEPQPRIVGQDLTVVAASLIEWPPPHRQRGTGSRESAVGRSYLPRNSCGPSDAV
jgi:hypothetical protein